jgi:predicted lysophospholipase L1 biosynthesis ABC-type transport system permease subunit
MSPSRFEIEGLVVPAYAVFALALGIFFGALLKRIVPAMTVALAAFVAVRLAVGNFLRPRYQAPEHDTATGLTPSLHARDWVLSNSLVDAVGRHISAARENLAIEHAQNARIDAQDYLLSLGWRRSVSFQPADRFWTFQVIEAAIFVGLAAAIVLVTLRLVQRTPA